MGVRARVVALLACLATAACGYDGPSVDVAALKAKLDAAPGSLDVVDVRPRALFDKGHILGARNVPLEDLDGALDALAASKTPLAIVCTCGKRSLEAIEKLRARGIRPYLVVGGMLEWEKAGYPVERGTAP